jgi:hypothetical protein
MNVTPLFCRMPASGKAMKPGISTIEPRKEAMRTPENLFSTPIYLEMTVSGTKKRMIETSTSVTKKAGNILINLFQDIFKAFSVFSLLAMREINNANPVIAYNQYNK